MNKSNRLAPDKITPTRVKIECFRKGQTMSMLITVSSDVTIRGQADPYRSIKTTNDIGEVDCPGIENEQSRSRDAQVPAGKIILFKNQEK